MPSRGDRNFGELVFARHTLREDKPFCFYNESRSKHGRRINCTANAVLKLWLPAAHLNPEVQSNVVIDSMHPMQAMLRISFQM